MKRKITALCSFMLVLSICIAIFGAANVDVKNDSTTAVLKKYSAPKAEETTSSGMNGVLNDVLGGLGSSSSSDTVDSVIGSIDGVSGDIESALGGLGGSTDILGGIGDAFGGITDVLGGIGSGVEGTLGGIFGGLGGTGSTAQTTAPATTSGDIGLIIPVPAATQTPTEAQTSAVTEESGIAGETVDYADSSNPYTKPTAAFTAGDEDETIKWLQWIFIYSGYGLKDNGITGVLDEDTVAVVKKLQHENGLTVDGNINEDVIKAAEVLYYQTILGDDNSAIEVPSDATTGVSTSNQAASADNGNGVPVVVLIVVLVIIWVLAIGGIVLLFVFKKKKMNAIKKAEEEQREKEAAEKAEKKESGISSLSDLFEEAERKDK